MSRDSIAANHLPRGGNRTPVSTYRIQLQPEFGFDAARLALDYLVELGATDIYLSPILQAAPGSTHGYDVVDHSQVSAELGGRAAFERLAEAAHARGLGVVVDVVPNHMAVPTPLYHNKALWSVLRHGADSPYADWFDGTASEDGILMPVLGARIGTVLADEELKLDAMVVPGFEEEGEVPVLRYWDHVFPVRPGTENLPLADLGDSQPYRLAYWKVADEELNYRRFFDVDTLVAVRVDDRAVFDATHALLFELFEAGHIDGFRIDHPDGLADPRGYMRWLSEATGGAWIVAEKILEGAEQLPSDWPIAGTTGYDSAWRIGALHVDPSGAMELSGIQHRLTGRALSLEEEVEAGKRLVATESLHAEIHRIATLASEICHDDIRLRDHTFRSISRCLEELVIAIPQYRAYVVPGEEAPAASEEMVREAAAEAARHLSEDRQETLEVVVDLVLGREVGSAGRRHEERRAELIVRFQQTCGAVMAKGVEDTAFFRWTHLVSAAEVGGAPDTFAITPDEFHAWNGSMVKEWPVTQTNGSTHDNKRSEDVRSRISVISQYAPEWRSLVENIRPLVKDVDGVSANHLLQVMAGTWTEDGPISADRLVRYIVKASREQKLWTTWTAPDTEREQVLESVVRTLLEDPAVAAGFTDWVALTQEAVRTVTLGTKAIQLTSLGVADLFNGTETTQTFLVDPDNRDPMDVAGLRSMLETAYARRPRTLAEEKMSLTTAVLHLRRRRPGAFVGEYAGYRPLAASTGHVVAFARGDDPAVCTVAVRLWRSFAASGGAGDHTVYLPEGTWRDVRTDAVYEGGQVSLATLVAESPAVVLEREDGGTR
ncbi:MAG TPA: malto-oligosyltrehalose synthase [Actinomycetales bacterium]|nr:malto-oligosyltrehalose synthase [Actinomycetales bacterium]